MYIYLTRPIPAAGFFIDFYFCEDALFEWRLLFWHIYIVHEGEYAVYGVM